MSDERPELTALHIHEYDQAFANTEDALTTLVTMYAQKLAEDAAHGIPEAATNVGLSVFLAEEFDTNTIASCLAVAIIAIARSVE